MGCYYEYLKWYVVQRVCVWMFLVKEAPLLFIPYVDWSQNLNSSINCLVKFCQQAETFLTFSPELFKKGAVFQKQATSVHVLFQHSHCLLEAWKLVWHLNSVFMLMTHIFGITWKSRRPWFWPVVIQPVLDFSHTPDKQHPTDLCCNTGCQLWTIIMHNYICSIDTVW